MRGSVCKICTWKCKQNVMECPFFTENTDIPVMHFNRQDGIVEWSGRVHTMGDIRPASSDWFVIGTSQQGIRRSELHVSSSDRDVMDIVHPDRVHYRESIPDNEGRSYPMPTFLGLDVVVSDTVPEDHIIIVTPQGERHSFGRNPSGLTLINLINYGIDHVRRRTGNDPRDPVEHVRMELTEGQRRMREAVIENASRHIEEGSISVPQNISIEIRDEQEPLNTGHSDNDSEVHSS